MDRDTVIETPCMDQPGSADEAVPNLHEFCRLCHKGSLSLVSCHYRRS